MKYGNMFIAEGCHHGLAVVIPDLFLSSRIRFCHPGLVVVIPDVIPDLFLVIPDLFRDL